MSDNQKLFTIPPGVEFLKTLAKSLMDGELVNGFKYDPDNPQQLANVTIYVPTRRAGRVLRAEFAQFIDKQSAILPIIKPLGETDDDAAFFDDDDTASLELLPPISKIQASLILGELILFWKKSLPAIFDQQLESVPLVAPANPADAIWLANDLFSLIESTESEEIDISLIDQIDAQDHADWWNLTLEFMKIVRTFWPQRLAELQLMSPAKHQIAAIHMEADRLEKNPPSGPVIIAGSTGSLPATSRLIGVVSKLQNGAVILPGLDQFMSAEHWKPLDDVARETIFGSQTKSAKKQAVFRDYLSSVVSYGHAQFGLIRLLARIGKFVPNIADVKQLGHQSCNMRLRQNLVSLALLPTDKTDSWRHEKQKLDGDITSAFSSMAMIEAANDREEAASIAAAMRMALEPTTEKPEPVVAVVTPDRNLAKRIIIALKQYGIDADDSGGIPMSQTDFGGLLRLVCEVAFKPSEPATLAGLLKHKLVLFAMSPNDLKRAISALERLILRGATEPINIHDLQSILDNRVKNLTQERHVSRWIKSIAVEDIELAKNLAKKIEDAFKTISDLNPEKMCTAAHWAQHMQYILEHITQSFEDPSNQDDNEDWAWESEAGQKTVRLIEEIIDCPVNLEINGAEWAGVLEAIIANQIVKPKAGGHYRAMIWGGLEARLQPVDTVILAGLNEGTWPASSGNDAFLSRAMKSQIGLEPPERRIGLAAHDFQMALGIEKVILSRALSSQGAPTVASRWVQRIFALLDDDVVKDMRERGNQYIDYAEDEPSNQQSVNTGRPEPKPAKIYHPTSYSFSEVSTLRRDPYAIYAKRILKLDPLEPFTVEAGFRERGTLYHKILERFSDKLDGLNPELSQAYLNQLVDEEFKNLNLPTHLDVIWRHRFNKVGQNLVSWEKERSVLIQKRINEASARCLLPGSSDIFDQGVYITGRADRIDLLNDASVEIIDFKTGMSPSAKEARTLLDPQLPLEAFAAAQGGFKDIGPKSVSSLKYIRLKPADQLIVDQIETTPKKSDPEPDSPEDLGHKAARELVAMIAMLASKKRGFLSRAIPKSEQDISGDYDHLARVSQWSTNQATQGKSSGAIHE